MGTSNSINQRDLSYLKKYFADRRKTATRTKYPQDIRSKVVALHQAGMTQQSLVRELGTATSVISRWLHNKKPIDRAPKIVSICPPKSPVLLAEEEKNQPLCLQVGAFRITIELARGA